MPKITIVVSAQEKELWVAAAHGEYVSLAEWLRRAANARLAEEVVLAPRTVEQPLAEPSVLAPVERPPRAGRAGSERTRREPRADSPAPGKGLCPHRVPLGSYCKRCEDDEGLGN